MSRRGEQGEHFRAYSVFSPRVLANERKTVALLTLLTPESYPAFSEHPERGGLA